MVETNYKKLELTWFNKDKVLVWDENKKDYVWVDPNDFRASEPRILIEKKVVGEINSVFNSETKKWGKTKKPLPTEEQNLLIKGDNLLSLKSLEEAYTGKINLVYIDPPFNTGNAFEHYDDGLEHSIWLSMMKSRLEILQKLLAKDGIIVVHIDYREVAHLKLLMDSIFRPNNMISIITLKVKDPAGVGQQSPIFDICEYLLVYTNDYELAKEHLHKKGYEYSVVTDIVGSYNKAIVNFGKPVFVKEINRAQVGKIRIYKCKDYEIKKFGKKTSFAEYLKHFDNVVADYNPSGGMILAIRDELPAEGLSYIEYTPIKGKNAGQVSKVYFLNSRILAWLSEIVEKDEQGVLTKRSKLTNIWEVVTASLPAEGNVRFPQGKKPETLLNKIISLCSNEGDWVLDSFAGSGTTGAVAHKLGRKWIMIEVGEQAETHCIKRIKDVINGEEQDKTPYGGGFRYCVLGKSVFKRDEKGIVEVTYDNGPLTEAICKLEGFKFIGKEFLDKTKLHGVINDKRYCHVSEEFVTQDYIDDLKKEIKEDESLVVYCLKSTSRRKLPNNIQIKKIPRDVVKRFKLE